MSDGAVFEPWQHINNRLWVDVEGVEWCLRRDGEDGLDERDLRRLAKKHGELRLVHVYDGVVEVQGGARDELLGRVRQFWAGELPPHSGFALAEFRDAEHRVMIVIQEWC